MGSANSDYSNSIKVIDDYSVVQTDDDEISDHGNGANGIDHREY